PARDDAKRDRHPRRPRPGPRARDRVDVRFLARLRVDQRRLPLMKKAAPAGERDPGDLARLVARAEAVLERVELMLPPKVADPDWSKVTAARWRKRHGQGVLQGVAHPHVVALDHLVAIDEQKRR